jgi:hypothetical protein
MGTGPGVELYAREVSAALALCFIRSKRVYHKVELRAAELGVRQMQTSFACRDGAGHNAFYRT